MLVQRLLERTADRHSDTVSLVTGERRWTAAALDQDANALAHALAELGVRRGDRVAVCLPNGADTVISIFAILKADGVFVVIEPSTRPARLAHILGDSGATVLITEARRADAFEHLSAAASQIRAVVVTGRGPAAPASSGPPRYAFGQLLSAPREREPRAHNIDVDLAGLVYTSGSSGRPKGVMLTHLNIVSATRSITTYLGNRPDDVVLNVLPLAFDYGLYQVFMTCQFGGTLVLERSFAFPATILSRIPTERVTGFPIVPSMGAMLLQLNLDEYDLTSLRYLTSTGAPFPVEHIRRLRALLPRVRVFSMYGLTECKRVAYLDPVEVDRRPESVGRAMPNVEAYVTDDAGRRVEPPGVGELMVRGSNVMAGYWNQPDETAAVLKPGPVPGQRVLRTGDIFRADEEGFLYFVGRHDDIIKTRGRKVSPREVENALYSLDGVVEAAVVGVPDDLFGQAVAAFVVRRPGSAVTEAEVVRHCASLLEDFMVPKYVEFRSDFVRTPSGKIVKGELRRDLTEASAG